METGDTVARAQAEGPAHILVCAGDINERVVAKLSCGRWRIVAVRDGAALLEQAALIQPAVVVCALRSKDIDGVKLCQRLRVEVLSNASVILLARHARPRDFVDGLAAGAAYVLCATCRGSLLRSRVCLCLDRSLWAPVKRGAEQKLRVHCPAPPLFQRLVYWIAEQVLDQ